MALTLFLFQVCFCAASYLNRRTRKSDIENLWTFTHFFFCFFFFKKAISNKFGLGSICEKEKQKNLTGIEFATLTGSFDTWLLKFF